MSPIEPLSPTSMNLSPISPSWVRAPASIPNTPVIGPSLCLLRLVTSFQNPVSTTSSAGKTPLGFQLPTPSLLSLNQVSAISEKMGTSVQSGSRYSSSVNRTDVMTVSPLSSSEGSLSERARSSDGPTAIKRLPILMRQNANEGLEKLVMGRRRMLANWQKQTADLLLHRMASSNTSPSWLSGTTYLTPRPHSRSPISKRRQQRGPAYRRNIAHVDGSKANPVLIIRSPVSPSTQHRNREIKARIAHLSHPLVPLVSVKDGKSHPDFPTTILQYQVLTHDQLDDLARWYHQTANADAREYRWAYPMPIDPGKVWIGKEEGADKAVDLVTKRRRWGRFIGLRGCESPEGEETVEELESRMEREWMDAIRQAREADAARDKMGRGWF